ncbi:MAG: HAD hydrolase family protein [Thermoplasmata archaeon]
MRVRTERTGFAIHIMPAEVSKAKAMNYLCKKLGIEPWECGAIGDGDNDAEMLEIAGFSGAPANASALAKRKAKYVARESYGRVFIEIVEKFIYTQ